VQQSEATVLDVQKFQLAFACPVSTGGAATLSLGPCTILGSRIVKVEPRPGSLATVMSPPII
jgi:hypothetical protein